MTDKVILETFHQYLGQPSPAMRPFLYRTHYIGRRGMEDEVDKYGDVVARTMLNGGDFGRVHDELKMMMNAIFRQAGFATTMKPPNLFHGKVPGDCIKAYLRLCRKKDKIRPDIIIHNHPKDANSAGTRKMNAIFDVKNLRIDKNEDFYSDTRRIFRRAVDTKVLRVRRDYMMRAEKLDEKCASNYTTHPFAEALKNQIHSVFACLEK